MLKKLALEEILSLFEKSSKTISFSLIVDASDVRSHDMLLNLNLRYSGYLPYYYGSRDGILFGKIKFEKNTINKKKMEK